MSPNGYSEAVWRLFTTTPRAGAWPPGDAVSGEAGTPANRSRLRLQVRLVGSRVGEARFQAYGCPTTIAVGAWLAQQAEGRTLEELGGIRADEIRQALEIPEHRTHCALLGEDVLQSLLHGAHASAQQPATR